MLNWRGRRGRGRLAVGFTTTCTISAYHHYPNPNPMLKSWKPLFLSEEGAWSFLGDHKSDGLALLWWFVFCLWKSGSFLCIYALISLITSKTTNNEWCKYRKTKDSKYRKNSIVKLISNIYWMRKGRIVITTNGTYPWSFVALIFRNGWNSHWDQTM
jgi:hypothetical protein